MAEVQLTFADFGERLFQRVLQPELLVRELYAAIPPDGLEAIEQVDGYTVAYRAAITQVNATREEVRAVENPALLRAYRFRFTVAFKLNLKVDILQGAPIPMPDLHEVFDVSGLVPLALETQIREPLVLFVDYEPLREEQLVMSTEKGQWHDLAMRFGKLEEKVRRKIVERVNAMLADSEAQRRIDIGTMVDAVLKDRHQTSVDSSLSAANLPPT